LVSTPERPDEHDHDTTTPDSTARRIDREPTKELRFSVEARAITVSISASLATRRALREQRPRARKLESNPVAKAALV
jgi:hypothetical protein